MRLGIDLDGVLADFNSSFIQFVELETGVKLPPVSDSYPDTWNYHLDGGVTAAQDDELWSHIGNSRDFWRNLQPLPGGFVDLANLGVLSRRGGHELYYITSRPGLTAQRQSEHWVFVHIGRGSVILADDPGHKGEIARVLRLNAFIDDRPENCAAVVRLSPSTRVFMPERPYNRRCSEVIEREMQFVTRVGNVTEMLQLLGLGEKVNDELAA